jgi:hypothetical protein
MKKTKQQETYTPFRVGANKVITIAQEIVEAQGLLPGDKFEVSYNDRVILMKKVIPKKGQPCDG